MVENFQASLWNRKIILKFLLAFLKKESFFPSLPLGDLFQCIVHVIVGFRNNFQNHCWLSEQLFSKAATWKLDQASWRGLLEVFSELVSDSKELSRQLYNFFTKRHPSFVETIVTHSKCTDSSCATIPLMSRLSLLSVWCIIVLTAVHCMFACLSWIPNLST